MLLLTCSQRSVRISFRRAPVSASNRIAAIIHWEQLLYCSASRRASPRRPSSAWLRKLCLKCLGNMVPPSRIELLTPSLPVPHFLRRQQSSPSAQCVAFSGTFQSTVASAFL